MKERRRPALLGQDADEIVLRVTLARLGPAVQNRGLAQLERETKMAAQVRELVGARREAAVIVEASLAHGDDRWIARELRDCRKVAFAVARHVRVDADAGVKPELPADDERGTR